MAATRRLFRRPGTWNPGLLDFRRWRSTAHAGVVSSSGCPFHYTTPDKIPGDRNDSDSIAKGCKPFEAIPRAKGTTFLGTAFDLLSQGGAAKLHEYCHHRHMELGHIFREKLGTVEAVIISHNELIQDVYRNEGTKPRHLVPEAWVIYNNMTKSKRGLFFMDGDDWIRRRRILNELILKRDVVVKYAPQFNSVVSDVMCKWDKVSREGDGVVPDLESDLYTWSIESLGMMLFNRRIGCTRGEDGQSEMQEFVSIVRQIFLESAKMTMIPPKLAYKLKLPVWRRFSKAVTSALRMSRRCVERCIEEIQDSKRSGQEVPGVLARLMEDEKINKDEIVSIVADLIIAAADTTSHATQWALYLLAKNPQCQKAFLSEITNAVGPSGEIKEEHLVRIPHSMWIIKESLRLYPIATFLTRFLSRTMSLGGYTVPKGTLVLMSQYTAGRDSSSFYDPDSFIPERWQRHIIEQNRSGVRACMPFGTGVRSCIGRRIAELQMRLLLSRTVQNFHLDVANEKDVEIAMRMITTPEEPIRLRLTRRST